MNGAIVHRLPLHLRRKPFSLQEACLRTAIEGSMNNEAYIFVSEQTIP